MSPRPATVSQADVVRAIKACQKAGIAIARIVVRGDGVAIETSDGSEAIRIPSPQIAVAEQPPVVL